MKKIRDAIVILFMSHKGYGKTWLMLKYLLAKLKNGHRAIIIDPNGKEPAWNRKGFDLLMNSEDLKADFKGAKVMFYDKGKTFQHIFKLIREQGMTGFTLVLDDLQAYGSDNMEPELKNIIRLSRNWGIDIMMTSHSWHQTPPILFGYVDVICLGPTRGNPDNRKQWIGGEEALAEHWKWKKIADHEGEKAPEGQKWKHPWYYFTMDGEEVKSL